jgi:3D (Asp-Asp-Asp) domain-containing protein
MLKKAVVAGSLAAALLVTGTAGASAASYTIKKGDTLSGIAFMHGTTVGEIAKENGIEDVNLIFPDVILEVTRSLSTKPVAKKVIKPAAEAKGEERTFVVTMYTAGVESTGKTPSHPQYGVTASGEKVQDGVTIAAAPNIPFGTRVYIPYFGKTFTVQDRGGAIKGNRIDVYTSSLNEAINFGKRELEVVILP